MLIKRIIKRLPILGYGWAQGMFELLHRIGLKGMNVGADIDFVTSGESFFIEYLKKMKKEKDIKNLTIFDVGANKGFYAKELISNLGGDDIIYSFEPSLVTYTELVDNTKEDNNVKCYNIGLSNEDEEKRLYYDNEKSGLASLYHRRMDHSNIYMNNSELVKLLKLDSFCLQNRIEKIDLLKIDVEGNELKVLEGASRMLNSGLIDTIQFEFGGTNIDAKTYFQDFFYLLKDRYHIYRLLKNGLRRIDSYNEYLENFIYTNFIAIKK